MIQTRHNNELKAAQTRNLIKKMNLEKLSIENDYKELKSKVGQLRNENFDKTREINVILIFLFKHSIQNGF